MSAVLSTNDVYAALIARILSYVPTGLNSEMPATALQNGALGKRCWVLQAPDNPTFPYVTLRLMARRGDPTAHSLIERFTLEVDCWNRPRSQASVFALQSIADQVEVALVDYLEPTAPLGITARTKRESIFYASAPADRDVVREQLWFEGWQILHYAELEIGTS